MTNIKVYDDSGNLYFLDCYENVTPKITYQFSDFQKVQKTVGGYSNTFRIPATKNNVSLFGPLNDPGGVSTYQTKKKKKCVIEINTIPVFEGFARLSKIVIQKGKFTEFEITIFGGAPSFGKDLGDAKLSDIDFSALNHGQTYTNVTLSWTEDLLSGNVVYPLADYGAGIGMGPDSLRKIDTIEGALEPTHFKPFIKAKYVLDSIFDFAGWKYESDFLTSEPFTNLVLSWVNHAGAKMAVADNSVSCAVGLLTNDTYTLAPVFFNPGWTDETSPYYDPDNYISSGVFTAPFAGDYTVTTILCARSTGGTISITWALDKNGAIIPGTANNTILNTGPFGTPIFNSYTVTLDAGDTLELKVKGAGIVEFAGDVTVPGYGCGLFIDGSFDTITQNMTAAAPDVKAADLINDFITLFNLVLIPSKEKEKTLIIEPFTDFIGTGDSVDWTEKLDVSKDYTIIPAAEYQKKQVVLTYQKDKDILNESVTGAVREDGNRIYGEKVINVTDNDFATGAEKIETKVLAATPCGQLAGSIIVAPFFIDKTGNAIAPKMRLLYWAGLQTIGAPDLIETGSITLTAPGTIRDTTAAFVTNGVEIGDEIRNLTTGQIAFVTGVVSNIQLNVSEDYFSVTHTYVIYRNSAWYIKHPTSGAIAWNQYPYAGQFETPNSGLEDFDLGFGIDVPYHYVAYQTYNNLFSRYYEQYLNETYNEDGRILTAHFNLSIADILSLKFNDRIYVLGQEWRINKVLNYGLGLTESVTVELVKITNPLRCRYAPFSVSLDSVVTFEDFENEISGTNSLVSSGFLVDASAPFGSVSVGDIVRNVTNGTVTTVTGLITATTIQLDDDIFTSTPLSYVVRSASVGNENCCKSYGHLWNGTECNAQKLPNIPPIGAGFPIGGGPVPVDGSGTGAGTITARLGTFPATRLGALGGIRSGLLTGLYHSIGEDLDTSAFDGLRIGGSNAVALHDGEDVIGGGFLRGTDPADTPGAGQAGRVVLIGQGSMPNVGDKIPIYVQGRTDDGTINVPEGTTMYMRLYVSGMVVASGTITSAGTLYFDFVAYRDRGTSNITVAATQINSTISKGTNPIKNLRLDLTLGTGTILLSIIDTTGSSTFTDNGYFTGYLDYVISKHFE